MSCQQTQEIDLMSFLADARSSAFAGFRQHYPTCAECSAEVRAWTELHLLLSATGGAAHPAEEQLLRFEDGREALPADERRALEAHLETCSSCADELRSLRGFDFAQLEASSVETSSVWRRCLENGLAGARGLLWHPAFAYALVLILLYPIVRGEWRETSVSPGVSGPHALEEGSFKGKQEKPALLMSELSEKEEADAPAPPESRAARGRQQNAPARKAAQVPSAPSAPAAVPPSPERERRRALAYSAGATRPALSADEASDAKSARNAAAAERALKEPAPRALAKRSDAQVFFAFERHLEQVAPKAEPLELTLEPDGRVELYASELGGGLHLRLPVPSGTPEGSLIEVRVAAPEGRREIRERFRLQANQTQLMLSLPPGWIAKGTHSVELRVTDAAGKDAPRYRSTLAVR